ncbi:cell division protein ZipA [Pseudoalteromonas sp. SMS1]|uniref:cell division protein ZipA n=1 Tax=Pseudoalteromonas sp. SMS1 TaxID=2908894 RepID=UPI001F332493|nr:cell division protein ZipA [Pseudoalteromonas sp. SMS1]MCF2860355.1 cell division protein ZipA [Pseudoalteromonas sp. SMS1]
MATELRWALIVISALIIGGLLVHGLWSVRKKEDKEGRRQDVPAPKSDAKTSEPELNDMSFTAVEEEPNATIDEPVLHDTEDERQATPSEDNSEPQSAPEPQDFIILHIQMPEGLTMAGSKLLPSVLSLGFKYSEEGFFNRHLESSGNGPVLFRLVNMYNPGTFDIDNMEQFSTAGVSLFMTLPCEGDSMAAFNMLHGAAKKLSDEFGAQVLDSARKPLTVDTIRAYVEKVREFAA